MEVDCEIFLTVILPVPLIQEGHLSVIDESMCTKHLLTLQKTKPAQGKVSKFTDQLDLTFTVLTGP